MFTKTSCDTNVKSYQKWTPAPSDSVMNQMVLSILVFERVMFDVWKFGSTASQQTHTSSAATAKVGLLQEVNISYKKFRRKNGAMHFE